MSSPIMLNDMDMDKYLLVPDWVSVARVSGSDRLSLGRVPIVQRSPSAGGRRITLTALREGSNIIGRFFKYQIDAITILRDAGTTVEFIYHDFAMDVIVPMDGIDVQMVGYRTNPLPTHPYIGTIALLEA